MFWIICAGLVAITATAIAAPLLRRRDLGSQPAAAYDLRIYRDQLREVERDLERRLIEPAEAERLRAEIGRKVLTADRALQRETADRRTPGGRVAVAVLALILLGGAALYARIGAPNLPDQPIAKRIALAQQTYDNRPSQSEAEAAAPKRPPPETDAEYRRLIEQLRMAVANNPDDPQGQTLLAMHEQRLGNLLAAKQAQARLVALKGDQASAADHAQLAQLTIEAAGGLITRDAEAELARALTLDPRDGHARYLEGLLQIQNGRLDRAFPIWAGLLAESPDNAPWTATLREATPDLAWFAGQPDYTPPEPRRSLPGPDADAMAAAQDMTPQQREDMVQGMVKGLEERLATQGGAPEEWARLISALVVIGQKDHAQTILAEARTRFAATPEALAPIEAAAQQSGLQ
ncbi:c-type cytochrome biogenesis protein CcmI [Paracoccus shanxieyensis]|uniref:C-type cytochrome biogenesis protein CcmI n=1 Tax=Paracoccus shanxieyensis TaxID=2675752 RepID=A0A6L6IVR0_9RHOB|nr:c-type cytochrome biogenesis protein CcmI [Paracoccus shanxieyensis]MTH62694.1 c-type cytochrome biogenesis protein CcmI [Paracoccus shanxieyensis]MTH86222.1 c-type cytochrome biogenesis protein CcmI [Paracoccus shanxieyensis]